uniref:PTS galactitol transporter subunit IIB n=1 Tax=Escherichia coli TaxID=562 RepID=UPI001FCECC15
MKRKIIVACGGAVATSTMAAEEIKELCQNHNIPVELIQCRVNEIETYMGNDSNLLIVFYVQIMPDDFV